MNFLQPILNYLATIPAVGVWLSEAISLSVALAAVVTALVGAWHAIVMLFEILASLPGMITLKPFADSLKADEAKVDNDSTVILSVLNRISLLPLPTQKKG